LNTEQKAKNKMQTIGTMSIPVLRYRLVTGSIRKTKSGQKNQENANYPWIASPKSRH
jgi:hypothetical protein